LIGWGHPDDRRFDDLRMGHECTFDFSRSDPVSGHVQDVVDPAGDPVAAVLVAERPVTGGVLARKREK
jgi:hypothetical protein